MWPATMLLHALFALLAAVLLHPLDVVRLRIQAAGTGTAAGGVGIGLPHPIGIAAGVQDPTAAAPVVRGLYDGLSAGESVRACTMLLYLVGLPVSSDTHFLPSPNSLFCK